MEAANNIERRAWYPLVLGFAILASGIIVCGAFYYRHYERQFRAGIEQQLSAIAELKVGDLAQYRKERLGDATDFFNNAAFSGLVRRFLDHPEDTEAQEQLRAWLDKYRTDYRYDRVFLLDTQGVERMCMPVTVAPASTVVSGRVAEALQSRAIVFQDFHRNEHNQQIYLTLLVPILDGPDYSRALGVLALRIDPATYLYPFINRWPTPSRTAETLLVRRDGNDALFLNELKFGTNTALNRRISIENTNVAAVKAVLGQKGIVEGMDYRGVPVVAAVRAIPDSPWFLVARMDTAEVYAPLRERLWLTVLLVSILLLGAGAGIGAIWRHQRVQFYKERLKVAEALRESEERFRRVFDEGLIGMAMLDQTFRFIQVNPAFAFMLGYSVEEMRMLAFPDITHPDHVQKDVEQVRRLLRGELSVYRTEKQYITKSGKELWGLVHVSVVRNAAGAFRHFLAFISDISERKKAEETLRQAHDELEKRVAERTAALDKERFLLQALMDNVPDNIYFKDRDSRLIRINKAKAQSHGASDPAQVVGKTDFDFFTEEHARQAYEDEQAIIRTGQLMTKEERETWPDRPDTWVSTIKMPLRDDGGNIIGTFGISRDVTARKQMEVALRQAHDELEKRVAERTAELRRANVFLDSIIENLPNMVFLKDARTLRFVRFNRAGVNLLGCSEADLLGKTDYDFFEDKELADLFTEKDRQVLRGKVVVDIPEEPLQTRAQGERILHTRKVPILNAAGEPEYLLGISEDITERKQAEAARRESEERLRSHTDNSPMAVVEWNADFIIMRWTGAAEKMFGWSAAEAIGKSITELPGVYEEDISVVQGVIQQLAAGGSKHVFSSNRNRTRNGQVIHCEWYSSVLHDAGGKMISVLSQVLDITERKRAEQALVTEQRLLNSLITTIPDHVYFKDRESRFVRINEAFARRNGLSDLSAALGKTDFDIFGEQHARQAYEDEKQIMATGKPIFDKEEREDWKDGHVTWVSSTKLPLLDNTGKIVGVMGVSHDITERKRAEAALRESQALYYSLVEQLPVGVFRKDPAGRYVLVNPWFCRLKGMKAEEFIGKLPEEVAAGEVAKQDPTGLAVKYAAAGGDHHGQIMQTGKPIELDEEYTDAGGKKQFIHAIKLPVFDLAGKVVGTQGILSDITELKQAAEVLRRSHEEFKDLFDNAPVGFHEVDAEGRLVRINNTELKMLGYSAEELLGQFVWKISAEEETSRRAALAKLGGEPPPPQAFGRMFRRKDGSTFPVLINDRILKGKDGAIVGIRAAVQDDTQRKRAEEVLRLSEERLLRVITQTRCILNFGQAEGPAGWRDQALSPKTPFRWDFPVQNEEAAQKVVPLELAPGERYQQAWTRSRNQADHAQMNWNSGNAFLNDLPFYRNEFRCVDKHGVGHWMQQFVTVQKLAENRWQVFGITTDISDLKRVETELRESQALYLSLVDQMPAGVFRKDPKGRYVFVNSSFCRLKEMTPDRFLGKTALELGLTDVALATKGVSHHETIMQSGNQIEVDEVYSRADGETRNYHVVKSPVLDFAGKIVGTQGILFDITDRKRAEEALRWSETQLHVILESTDNGILAVDSKGKVITANRRFAEIWRVPQPLMDAGDDRALLDFVMKQLSDPAAFLKKVQSLYNSDAVDMDTLAFKDGRIFERFSFPMMMEGAVIGRVWSFRDITERKRQEEELKQKNTELERFTYTVSHDLKSPLVTVKTFLGYLEQDLARPDLERVKQDVAYMHTATKKMGQLLDELLSLARVGRKSNPAVRVTFQELAQEAVRLVAGRISTGGVKVQVADAVVTLEGDRPRLMEIWQNLVENACKFMGNQPQPQIEIGVEQRGLETVFFVRDNGAGIDPRFQAKVFGLFEKLDPKGEGTGMGLALVKRIVELYAGRIWVESDGPGRGANFLFTLPEAVIIEME